MGQSAKSKNLVPADLSPANDETAERVQAHWMASVQTAQQQGNATCDKLGLKTTEEKRTYVLAILRQSKYLMLAMAPPIEREPGSDDEPTRETTLQAIQELKDDLPWQHV